MVHSRRIQGTHQSWADRLHHQNSVISRSSKNRRRLSIGPSGPTSLASHIGAFHPRDRQRHLGDHACAVLGDGVLHVVAERGLVEIDGSRDETPIGPSSAI
jgi:hypothetical protein